MSDRTAVSIFIGGEVPADVVDGLCRVICLADVTLGWDRPAFLPTKASDLLDSLREICPGERAGIPAASVLALYDAQSTTCGFDDLEDFLRAHKIPFTRCTQCTAAFDGELVEYRPAVADAEPPRKCIDIDTFTDHAGRPTVVAEFLHPHIEMLAGACAALDANPPESPLHLWAIHSAKTALSRLRGDVPPEVPPLPAFKCLLPKVDVQRQKASTKRAKKRNIACSARARAVLDTYEPPEDVEREDVLTDLLADLCHYCRHHNLDLVGAFHTAVGHFEEEVKEVQG